ncbi:Uncharacterised protein [Streptococcus suis]|nr:Uncharacterised protein [Streptococcus suis]
MTKDWQKLIVDKNIGLYIFKRRELANLLT